MLSSVSGGYIGMLVSHTWLRQWISPKMTVLELAERLTSGGLEVESVTSAGPTFQRNRVIIGHIISIDSHPGANNLKLCEVDIGRRAMLRIICGAANATAGSKVPVATIGAKLPELEVQSKNIRGVESAGMICSAAELGLQDQSDGIMILDHDAPVGMPISQYLDLADQVIEIELTPNRGDCLGMRGIAREVSALTGSPLKKRSEKKSRVLSDSRLPVDLKAPHACPRYAGRAVRNIDMSARTPDWMAERLRRSGVRSLNVVVDVTNYVMLELGQPMHAFDMDKLAGGIVVRMARKNEKLQLLDGSTVELSHDNLVIADQKKAVALAGIMGGKNSAISDLTRHIYFEAAFFPASEIIGKARKFGMHTDASHRFERGVDPGLQVVAMERATELLTSLAGGEPGPVTDARERQFTPRPARIKFIKTEIPRMLGITVPGNTVSALLKRLGMRVTPIKQGWNVTVPGWRSDITGPHDLVEEVGRVYGFDKIAPRLPLAAARVGGHPENRNSVTRVKQKLIERGYFEAITYSFVDPGIQQPLLGNRDGIKLTNPIADNMSVMRQSLWPGLLEAVKMNLNRQHDRVRLFEVGHAFLQGRKKGSRVEAHHLGGAATGLVLPRQWGVAPRKIDFYDVKGDLEALFRLSIHCSEIEFHPARIPALHPGRCAQIRLGKQIIGYLGQLHPGHHKLVDIDQPVYLFELNLAAVAISSLPHFSTISRYPSVQRDLAVVADSGVEVQDVLVTVRSAAGNLLTNLELFDIYVGERIEKDQKSFAFSLTFQSESSNLTAREVDAIIDKIIGVLQRKLGAQLRT